MKNSACIAILARQNAITKEEWIKMIQARTEMLKPHFHDLTLRPLEDLSIIYDDYGLHKLKDYSHEKSTNVGWSFDMRGIYPLEDEKFSSNTFLFSAMDRWQNSPISTTQKFWALNRDCSWVTIQINSDIANENDGMHVNRRCTPKEVICNLTELDDSFWIFVKRTPRQIWQRLGDAIKELAQKRRERVVPIFEIEEAIKIEEYLFNFVPR